LHGTVYDGLGRPIPDALVEIRQADESGTVPVVEGSLRLSTRAYLPGDMNALSKDVLLPSVGEGRRETLIAVREPDGSLRFDIRLQGDDETVFLTFPRHEE
jgi:protocatechuate 3,4-dioxygenase, alpha subunit